jgi:hypothetical protein
MIHFAASPARVGPPGARPEAHKKSNIDTCVYGALPRALWGDVKFTCDNDG